MNKQHYAIQRSSNGENEIKHWKYIRREKKPNGKYRYYYEKDKYKLQKGIVETSIDGYDGSLKIWSKEDKTGKTTSNRVAKDLDEWLDRETGRGYYVGDMLLRQVVKEQISVGKHYVDDLINGRVYNETISGAVSNKIVSVPAKTIKNIYTGATLIRNVANKHVSKGIKAIKKLLSKKKK